MFALVVVGWLITAAALVTETERLLAVAAPFFLIAGASTLMSAAAWTAIARQATAGGLYGERYRDQVAGSRLLRMGMGVALVVFGIAWLAFGTLL